MFAARKRPRSLARVPVRLVSTVALFGLALQTPVLGQEAAEAESARAKSVVLFVGDGVDDHILTIARNYLYGNVAGKDGFSFDRFEARAAAVVQTVSEDGTPVYVGDSASGGTALSAGVVTSRGRIATTAGTDLDVPTILELARDSQLRTGVVTTASLTDATPASFVAHIAVRYCEGPVGMEGNEQAGRPGCPNDKVSAGGPGSIAEQIAVSRADLLLGGGLGVFSEKTAAGDTALDRARAAGYRLVDDAASLSQVDALPVLGLFGPSTLPVEWTAEGGVRAARIEVRDKRAVYPEPHRCIDNPDFGRRPTLQAMTRKALELLGGDGSRFFLVVESASIDKQAHAREACGHIGETRALDQSVQAALEFAGQHPETLVLVTSDHGHAAQIVPVPSLFTSMSQFLGPQHPPGFVAVLDMPHGGIMGVNYGTNRSRIEEHTGTQIPVFAQGPGSELVRGLMRQADVFEVMRQALGFAEVER
ncbi:MAG: alkaline phosphatase [Acidobacteriota bacterium]